ncbi:MAG: M48 family metallopeptidase [Kofleriaceae bacterium]|nr:M48 family metallopeptidase [Myxococcales bacterium]MCB9559508.1 M48 family metallopeptidase [Kofleriaceae bacterium]
MTAGVDFDFARYVQERRGQAAVRARDGSAYAYVGERKVRRTLSSARPVTMALEGTTRLWRDVARAELLGSAVKVTDQQFPRVHVAARAAADALRMRLPPVYAAPTTWSLRARALGTDDAPYIVVNAQLADQLDDAELVAAIGHELGHVQNGHVLYATALHYLTQSAFFFVRWIVQPAIMALQAWSRRAEISCDRAALLACKDLEVTLGTLVKLELGLDRGATFNLQDYLEQLPDTKKGFGRYAELFRSHPYLPKRVQALRVFADGAFYAAATGADPAGRPTADEVDKQVAGILAVF